MSFEDQIRERAYQIWLAGGMADGQAHEHWVCAEQAVLGAVVEGPAQSVEPVVIITKAEPKAAKPRKIAAAKSAAKSGAKSAATSAAPRKVTRARKVKSVELSAEL